MTRFGICLGCDRPIEEERLQVLGPETELCVACAFKLEGTRGRERNGRNFGYDSQIYYGASVASSYVSAPVNFNRVEAPKIRMLAACISDTQDTIEPEKTWWVDENQKKVISLGRADVMGDDEDFSRQVGLKRLFKSNPICKD